MCLAVVALDAHPRYAVVLAANRDEYHARPAQASHWWRAADASPILADRDLAQGGTWLGLAPDGRFAFVTNVREPGRFDPNAPSRGALVPALLRERRGFAEALAAIVADAADYNGFNLVAGDSSSAAFGSNRAHGVVRLARGIHGVSNAGLDTPWPKLLRAKAGLAAWVASANSDPAPLWHVLADTRAATDDELPDTGIGRERERLLSSPFIVSPDYGTRCSTLVLLGRDGSAQWIERSFDSRGTTTNDVEFRFALDQAARSMTRWEMPASSKASPLATNP
jgi:uncharacterized protein with NRDE domain